MAESQLEPGDLVFFGEPIHHVVIYIANGLIVQAPHTGDVVKVARLSDFEAPTACRRYLCTCPEARPPAAPLFLMRAEGINCRAVMNGTVLLIILGVVVVATMVAAAPLVGRGYRLYRTAGARRPSSCPLPTAWRSAPIWPPRRRPRWAKRARS